MIRYRTATEADRALVLDSWVDSYKFSHAAGLVHLDDWDEVMTRQVNRVLDREGVMVWVAADSDFAQAKADILGWICIERDFDVSTSVWRNGKREKVIEPSECPLVHFCYVRQPYRGSGVARALFKAARIDPAARFLYTCNTAAATKIRAAGKIPDSHWSPLIARHPKRRTNP
jgi:GNAT superfamily N-acetyltransferase